MNTKETLNADKKEISDLFFNQIKALSLKNLSSFDSQFSAWGGKMNKYASKKELYSDEVSKILIDSNLICADDHDFYKGYLLGVA